MRGFCWSIVVVMMTGFGACSPGSEVFTECSEDSQCDPNGEGFSICNKVTGACDCVDDRFCEDGEICNATGRCQVTGGCLSNDQCTTGQADTCANQFCDITTGSCKGVCECDAGEGCCVTDSQCGFGSVCDVFQGACVDGCRSDGDCRLGEGCIGATLGGGLGQCAAGVCTANNLCVAGQICNLQEGECVFDVRGPYCQGCSGGVASEDCGFPANYCLTDTSDPTGSSEFCGVDCSQDQACPFGYGCNDVIIVPPSAPFCRFPEVCVIEPGAGSGICSRSSETVCTIDEECPEGPPGSNCPRATVGNCQQDQQQECTLDSECCEDAGACPVGSCVKQECRGREGAAFGTCSCTRDLDCPRDECIGADLSDPVNPVFGNCSLAGHQCVDNADCDVIACVDGGCRIGANCAPANDRNCRELLQTPEPNNPAE